MAEQCVYCYRDVTDYDPAAQKHLNAAVAAPLAALCQRLAELPDWDEPAIHQAVVATAEAFELKMGKLAQPLRVAVTGGTVSPPIDVTLRLLGRERVLQRIDRCLEYLASRTPA